MKLYLTWVSHACKGQFQILVQEEDQAAPSEVKNDGIDLETWHFFFFLNLTSIPLCSRYLWTRMVCMGNTIATDMLLVQALPSVAYQLAGPSRTYR
jgi:hypothetical protein